MQRLRAGQIDVDDLTFARRSADNLDLARFEAKRRGNSALDGAVSLTCNWTRANPHLERLTVDGAHAFDSRARVRHYRNSQLTCGG